MYAPLWLLGLLVLTPASLPVQLASRTGTGDASGCIADRTLGSHAPPTVRDLRAAAAVSLQPVDACVGPGEDSLVVQVVLNGATVNIVGAQLFLAYDHALLDFTSVSPGDPPFTREIARFVDEAGGTIDYFVGVPDLPNAGADSGVLAVVSFEFVGPILDACDLDELVAFRFDGVLPTELADETDAGILPGLTDLVDVRRDQTPPVLVPGGIDSCYTSAGAAEAAALAATGRSDNCTAAGLLTMATEAAGACSATVTVNATDECGNEALEVQYATVIDGSDPELVGTPADVTVSAAAGTCSATVVITPPTAIDDCDSDPIVLFVRSDQKVALGDPFDAEDSPVVITWIAVDACGNAAVEQQTIAVNAVNEVLVHVDLFGVWDDVTRCITFESLDATVQADLAFASTGEPDSASASGVIVLPCGESRSCLSARDELHTLRRTVSVPLFSIVGDHYEADFREAGAYNEAAALVGGNLDASEHVDAVDFAIYVNRFAAAYDSDADTLIDGDTPCAWTPSPLGPLHADVSGNGLVDTADFTFIEANILRASDPACGALRAVGEPVMRIAVRDLSALGLGDLAGADLNHDGWLDEADLTAFMQGARPGTGGSVGFEGATRDHFPRPVDAQPRPATRP